MFVPIGSFRALQVMCRKAAPLIVKDPRVVGAARARIAPICMRSRGVSGFVQPMRSGLSTSLGLLGLGLAAGAVYQVSSFRCLSDLKSLGET